MICPSCGSELEKRPYYISIDTRGLPKEERIIVHKRTGADYYYCNKCALTNYDSMDRFKFHFHHSDKWYQYGEKNWTLIKNPIIKEQVVFT